MKQHLAFAIGVLVVAGIGMTAYAATSSGGSVKIDSFEFLGCSGDWTDSELSPEIWRMGSASGTTYLVRHPATCGANVARGERATFSNGTLDLHYEPYSKDGVYAMCMCEFWAKFSFRSESTEVRSATFDSQPARLKGSWAER